MSRLATRFGDLRARGRKGLVTYQVAGDPDPAHTVALMAALVAGGADVLELGVPFSDPEAEGPDIQAGHERALAHGTRLLDVLEHVRRFREDDTDTPIVLMGYLNSVERMGYEQFAAGAAGAGVDGVILVNLPPEAGDALRSALAAAGIDLIVLLAPTTTDARARDILARASGFAYYVSLKGTTGAGHIDTEAVAARLGELRRMTDLPLAVGFGIRDGASARAVGRVADAVVVGSEIVRCIDAGGGAGVEAVAKDLTALAFELRAGLDADPQREAVRDGHRPLK